MILAQLAEDGALLPGQTRIGRGLQTTCSNTEEITLTYYITRLQQRLHPLQLLGSSHVYVSYSFSVPATAIIAS